MAITSMDGLVVGLQSPQPILKAAFTGQAAGGFHSSLYLAGLPGAAIAPTPGLAGAALTSYAGQLTFPPAVTGQTIYLAGIDAANTSSVGAVMLVDRLWHNSGIVSATTTAQTVNSVAFPARDVNGAVSGAGILVGLEVSTATTNGSPITNTTMSYTNSAGTAGQTASIASFPANAVVGTFVPFALAAGDLGAQSIQTITLGTSYGTGVVNLVAYRIIHVLGLPATNLSSRHDAISVGLPIMYTTSVPFMIYILSGTTGGITTATISYARG